MGLRFCVNVDNLILIIEFTCKGTLNFDYQKKAITWQLQLDLLVCRYKNPQIGWRMQGLKKYSSQTKLSSKQHKKTEKKFPLLASSVFKTVASTK